MDEKESKQAVWALSTSNPEIAEKLKKILRSVEDPELGYNVIELGLIRDVVLTDESLRITMILTTPFCPYAGDMVENVRLAAAHASDAQVFVDLRFDPWDPAMMEEGLDFDWGLF